MAQQDDPPVLFSVAGVFAVAYFGVWALVIVAPLVALLIWAHLYGDP